MPTLAEQYATIAANLAAELAGETARRAAIVAAGNPAPTTYSVGGKSFDWNGYLATMMAQIKEANALANAAAPPFEEHMRGYS